MDIIDKMKNNPKDVKILEIIQLLENYDYKLVEGKTHYSFINSLGDIITIKKECELKPIYVREAIKRIGM